MLFCLAHRTTGSPSLTHTPLFAHHHYTVAHAQETTPPPPPPSHVCREGCQDFQDQVLPVPHCRKGTFAFACVASSGGGGGGGVCCVSRPVGQKGSRRRMQRGVLLLCVEPGLDPCGACWHVVRELLCTCAAGGGKGTKPSASTRPSPHKRGGIEICG